MRKFVNSLINILINSVIIVGLLALCVVGFIIVLSISNDISIKDTISYVKSFRNNNNITLNDINSTDTYLNNSITGHIQITNVNNKFYYNQLDDNSKLIYDALENNIDNLKKDNYTIDFSTTFNDLLNQTNGQNILDSSFQTALDAFFYDHPELFYIDLTKINLFIKYTTIGPITKYTVSIIPKDNTNYLKDGFYSEEDVNDAISSVEKIRDNIISNLPNSDDYTKVLKVHDMLVSSLEYNYPKTKNNTHNIYGALIEKQVVCEGYAKTFKYILDSLNIECILVNGTATNSSRHTDAHMWNYLKLDGNWYGVDVTWDDPIVSGGYNKNIIRRDYFCKGSNVFNESHVVSNKISDEGNSFSIPTLSKNNYK